MGAIIEIAYYNTFILAGGTNEGDYHIEENRIKGGFNNKAVDLGARAYLVDEEYNLRVRKNAMIYSGIFNAKTKVNNTNQFPIGEEITKAVDIANGSIQKLYAEDTNLVIFQENKVNKALIDKDAIFTAEGSPLQASSNIVIGQIVPFAGKYGISKNPESFAVYGNRKYFADKNRGIVLRLSQDGITPISDAGMKDFFRDNLPLARRVYGMYDESKQKYVISVHNNTSRAGLVLKNNTSQPHQAIGYSTLSFDEGSKGWTSFFTYKPTFGFSLRNNFYTFDKHNLWRHYSDLVPRCSFYGSAPSPAIIEFLFNDEPGVVKSYLTIGYEGSSGWKMISAETDMQIAYPVLSDDTSVSSTAVPVNFLNRENKYYGHLRNNTTTTGINQVVGVNQSGIKGYFNNVKMQYWRPGEFVASKVKKAELFNVFSEAVLSST